MAFGGGEEGGCEGSISGELLDLRDKAARLGIYNALIVDRGLTQIEPNTPTALGIGPAEMEIVDKITKHLKLL